MAEKKKAGTRKTTARKTPRSTASAKKTTSKTSQKETKKVLKVTLIRGLAGKRKSHIESVRSLGLRKPGQSRVLEDNPMVRGNIRKAHYLIKVEEVQNEAS